MSAVQIVTDDLKAQIYRLEGLQRATPEQKTRFLMRSIIAVERQAKINAPVKSGQLRRKMSHRVEGANSAVITAGVVYGRIQEFGGVTKPHDIKARPSPFRTEFSWRKGNIIGKRERGRTGGVLAFMVGGKLVFAKSVKHPGSRIKPKHYTRDAFEQLRPQIEEDARKLMAAQAGKGEAP